MSKYQHAVTTLLVVFATAMIGMVIAHGTSVLNLTTWGDWKPYVAAGIAAVLTFAFNWLNQFDSRYGISSK